MLLLLYSSLFKILFIALGAAGGKAMNPNKYDRPDFRGSEGRQTRAAALGPGPAPRGPRAVALRAWPCRGPSRRKAQLLRAQ